MKWMRLHVMLIALMLLALRVLGGIVPVEDARIIARNVYFERVQPFRTIPLEKVIITGEFTVAMAGEPVYFVFNIGNNDGFVIISADDEVYPILGYSFSGSYRTDDHHPAFAAQLNLYEEQILYVRKQESTRLAEIDEVWDKYLDEQFAPAKDILGQTVGPLCKTKWDQDGFYNDSCPGNSVTGCVATAMAQVMKAFAWPVKGKGSYSYTHPSYGVQYANFGNTTYKWSQMTNEVVSPNAAVAQLIYHCGVSVDMNYSPGGSGASMYRAKDAFYYFFRYSPFVRLVNKSDYTDIYWKILIRAQHMNGRPVMYSGPGHAFVCDGFQYHDHFHFNWGWGGSYDGYFYLNDLRPGYYNLTNGQDAIVDNYPDTATKYEQIGEGGMRSLLEGDLVQFNPNPSPDGRIRLTMMNDYTGDVTITVFDPSGRMKEQLVIRKEHEWEVADVNFEHLGSGFYLARIQIGNQTINQRFIINR